MKLLIITQKVDINDSNLGFFHRWLEKFAERLDKLYIICLWQGKYNFPKNTIVYSLGKEKGYSKLRQLFNLQKFLFKCLPELDGVFIHMCPIYALASYPLVKIFGKKMILWFTHSSVTWKLKLAEKCVDRILTASKESCRLKKRNKIEIIGHGIDSGFFKPLSPNIKLQTSDIFKILSPGRISPIKDQRTLIKAVDILINHKSIKNLEVKIIGSPLEDYEKEYFKQLKNLVKEKELEGYIKFLGSVPYAEMPKYYQESDLMVNLSHTGSIDKVVLEAMACSCLVLTSNEAFANILHNKYLFREENPQELAEKIISLKNTEKDKNLREIVIKKHSLDGLIEKIIQEFYG